MPLLLFTAIFTPLLVTHDTNEIHYTERNSRPSREYLPGTDHLGRDLYSRIVFGARVSVIVGLSADLIAVTLAALIGVTSGFFGGRFDLILQSFVDGIMAFPMLLISQFEDNLTGMAHNPAELSPEPWHTLTPEQ